ncbi:replication protein [Paenibacillus radicis (ex Xue et al. 2023)]|uniref:Replication protein n=1 Tax=Paenibacillus radicis (ex Xue et al. 2023) TaxID=2972489 RepID=A0ABT1YJU4_9BACL|nr:replication protein [Paenibacillus radicis (ex Xue et al. 2023)]MCR8633458.1 replication protein [Paenibacillus radicis (ex Xue et al. 2023)]
MANVQPEHGTTSIANELIRQVFMTGKLTKTQFQIVFAIIDESWSWLDRRHGRKYKITRRPIKPKELSNKTKLHISDVCKTINALVEAKVIRRHWDYYRFNKDYESWDLNALATKKTRENTKSTRDNPHSFRENANSKKGYLLGENPSAIGETPNKDDETRENTNSDREITYQGKSSATVGSLRQSSAMALGEIPNDTREIPYSWWGKSLMRWPSILRAARVSEPLNKKEININKLWSLYDSIYPDFWSKSPECRYDIEELEQIFEYFQMLKHTRSSGKLAEGIIEKEMDYWERFDKDLVLASLWLHREKHKAGKKEDYTRGIIRRTQDERKRGIMPNVLNEYQQAGAGLSKHGGNPSGTDLPQMAGRGKGTSQTGSRRITEEHFDSFGIGQ